MVDASLVGQGSVAFPEVGHVGIAWTSKGIARLWFGDDTLPGVRIYQRLPGEYGKPLRAYAAGKDVDLNDVPLDLHGTDFQLAVWHALRRVPRGQLRTYAGIAADIDRPRAMRAVGSANAKNPVPIVVPCHRIVERGNPGSGSGYRIGGYSAGLDRKRALLALEGVRFEGDRLFPGQLPLFD